MKPPPAPKGTESLTERERRSLLLPLFFFIEKTRKEAVRRVSSTDPEEISSEVGIALLKAFRASKGYIRRSCDAMEALLKKKAIAESRPSPFWLCSSHADCASDHEAWQGKVYADERMRSSPSVRAFLKKNPGMSIQKVTSSPAWLITRPNCRHFLEPLTEKEAKENTKSLLKRKKMVMKEGDRAMRTRIAKEREYREKAEFLFFLAENAVGAPDFATKCERLARKALFLAERHVGD